MEGKRYVPFGRLSRQPLGTPVHLQTRSILTVMRDQRDSELEECKPYRDEERCRGSGVFLGALLESLCSLNINSVPSEVV